MDQTSQRRDLLEVQGLNVHFRMAAAWGGGNEGSVRAVDGVDLTIRAGETLALVGESGCGKTTLGRTVAGLLVPTSGLVRYVDEDPPSEGRGLLGRAQMVFQDSTSSLDPRQHVRDIIAEPLTLRGFRKTDARVQELIRVVGLGADAAGRFPHEFSGGQRQRIGIARAIAAETGLVICDEPTSSLDVSIQAQIIILLRELQERLGVSFLYISHDLAAVRNIAHRVAVMYFGKVIELGDVDQIYRHPRHPYTVALLSAVPRLDADGRRLVLVGDPPSPTNPPIGCRFQDRCWLRAQLGNPEICVTKEPVIGVSGGAACHFADDLVRPAVVAASALPSPSSVPGATALPSSPPPPASPLLTIANLQIELPVQDGVVRAVRGLSLQLARGESVGLVGESGSGKTMTALSILRLLPHTARIRASAFTFDGVDLLRASDKEMRRIRGGRVGMIFQDPLSSLNPVMTVGSQITEAVGLHLGLSRAVARRRAADLLGWVGVPQPNRTLDRYPHQLSGGMRQRAMIAMALSADPALLIADEPTTAVDVTVQAQIIELLRRIKAETGMSLLLITHDLGVAAELVDRLETMYAGRIVEEGPVQQLVHRPRHPYTMALLRSRPTLDGRTLRSIGGAPPDLRGSISGCAFAPRCRFAIAACANDPALEDVEVNHRVACWVAPTADLEGADPPTDALLGAGPNRVA
jgi:peptide/nickel transport system ATP-binding protein